jgi:hypothetical protein
MKGQVRLLLQRSSDRNRRRRARTCNGQKLNFQTTLSIRFYGTETMRNNLSICLAVSIAFLFALGLSRATLHKIGAQNYAYEHGVVKPEILG